MKIFTKFGDLIIKTFSLLGMLIMEIPRIPERLRSVDTGNIRDKVPTERIKDNVARVKTDNPIKSADAVMHNIKNVEINSAEVNSGNVTASKETAVSEGMVFAQAKFTSKEKENTIFRLQILSGAFLVASILYIFSFLPFAVYVLLGLVIIGYMTYVLFNRVKLMYPQDFNAYRDFFYMYIAVGIIMVILSSNPAFVNALSFQYIPSLSVLIFAVVAVIAVLLIFRVRYYRNFTYGTVVEAGKKTAHVKVEYDIRSNVKPDLYLVQNSYDAEEGDVVKLKIEEKLFSTGGNKPMSILKVIKKI